MNFIPPSGMGQIQAYLQQQALKILEAPKDLQNLSRPVRVDGTVINSGNGQATLQTAHGNVTLETKSINLVRGQSVELILNAGTPPRTGAVIEQREAPTPNKPSLANSLQQAPPMESQKIPLPANPRAPAAAITEQAPIPAKTAVPLPLVVGQKISIAPVILSSLPPEIVAKIAQVIQQTSATLPQATQAQPQAAQQQAVTQPVPLQTQVAAQPAAPVTPTTQQQPAPIVVGAIPQQPSAPVQTVPQQTIPPAVTTPVIQPTVTPSTTNPAVPTTPATANSVLPAVPTQTSVAQTPQPATPLIMTILPDGKISIPTSSAPAQPAQLNTQTAQAAVPLPQAPAQITTVPSTPTPQNATPQQQPSPQQISQQQMPLPPSVPAQIVGMTPQGNAVISLSLPDEPFPLLFTTQQRVTLPAAQQATLPVPVTISLERIATTPHQMPALITVADLLPRPVNTTHQWASLRNFLQYLAVTAPQSAQQFSALMPNLASPANLGAAAILILSIVRGGDMKGWLEERLPLTMNGAKAGSKDAMGAELLKLLQDDIKKLATTTTTQRTEGGDWRIQQMPFFWQNEIVPIDIFSRFHRHDDEKNDLNIGKRFIIQLNLSRIGQLQVDGFVRERQLDTIIRTNLPFSTQMQEQLSVVYATAMQKSNLTGQIIFHGKIEQWLDNNEGTPLVS